MANKLSLDDVLSGNFAKARLDDTKPSNTNKLSLKDVLAGNFNKKTTLPTTDPDIITPSRRSDNTRNKPKVINPEIKEGLGYMGKRAWTGLTQDAPAAAIQALGLSVGKAISEFNTESPITAFDKIKKADSFGDKLSAGLEGIVNYSPYTNGPAAGPAAAVPKTLANVAKGVVDVFTNKEDAEKTAEKIFNYAEPFVERSEEVQREGEKYPDWVQTGAKATGAVGMMLPSIALSALTRSPNVGLTAMSMMAGGSAGKEAYDKTGDLDVAWNYGAAAGVTEFATERMFRLMDPFLGASGADKAIKKMLSGLNDYKVVKTLLTGALGATGEGIEEVIVELVDPYLRRATFDPNAPQAKKEDLVEVFTVGALAGLIMKGTMGPIQAVGDNKQRRQYVQQKADAANELASMLPTEHRPEILEITSRTTIEEVDEYYGKIIDAANTAEQEIGNKDYSEYPLDDNELEGNPRLAEVREKYKDEVEKLESLYGTINLTPEQREEATTVHSIDVATLEKDAQDAARDFYLPPKMRLEKAIVEGIAHKYYSPEVVRRYIDQKKEADKAIKPKVLVGGKQVDKTKFMSQLKEKDPTLEDNELEEMFIKAQLESSRNLKVEEFVMQTNEAFSQYGVKVDVSYYLPKQERGFYDPKTKTITLNAKTIKSRSVASYVLSHEITHYAIAKDPELLSQLKQSAKLLDYDIAQHNEGIRNAYEKRTGQTLSEEYLTEESIADFVSTVLQEDNLLMQLANKKPTTLQRVAQVITDALMYTRQDRAIRKYKKDVAKKLSAALEGRLVVEGKTPIKYSLENENVGYRAGEFGKSERYFNMMSGNRGTGHFGTGTYFVGDPSKIELEDYNKRTQHMVDFNGYNLFKPRTSQQAFDLHDFLKFVNYDNQKLGALNYSTDQIVEEKNKVYNATESILDFLSLYDFDKEKVFKASDEYFDFTDAELIKENEEYARNKEIIKAAIANRALISWRAINNIQNGVGKGVGYKTPEWKVYNYYSGLQEYFEENFTRDILETQREVTERLNIGARVLGLTVEDLQSELQYINERYAVAPSWFDEEAMAQDTPATIFMKRLGYEGVDVRGLKEVDNTAYGSVIYDLNPSSIRYSLSPDFYNKSTKLIETKLPKNLNGTQTLEWLRNGQNIREEELKWTGLAVYLTEKGSEKVSKEELLEFIAANELPISEVLLKTVFSEEDWPEDLKQLHSEYTELYHEIDETLKSAINKVVDENITFELAYYHKDVRDPRVYAKDKNGEVITFGYASSHYNLNTLLGSDTGRPSLEGVQVPFVEAALKIRIHNWLYATLSTTDDYEETTVPLLPILQRLKDVAKSKLPSDFGEKIKQGKLLHDSFYDMELMASRRFLWDGANKTIYDFLALKPHSNYKELLFHWDIDGSSDRGGFRSGHFNETGGEYGDQLLMHARISDGRDVNSGKVLFIEELQSDWHEQGLKEGYMNFPSPAEEEILRGRRIDLWALSNRIKDEISSAAEDIQNNLRGQLSEVEREILEINMRLEPDGEVSDAPLKKTWHEFLLKRLIAKAAQEDYSRIAWTTGQQQIDRYPEMVKPIIWVQYSPMPGGGWIVEYKLQEKSADDSEVVHSAVVANEQELKALVGQRITRDIVNKRGVAVGSEFFELSYPEVVQAGGEGMINFYNIGGKSSQNIARFLDKYGKQWGARVEMAEIDGIMQPSMEITPEMRESVLKYGQELRYSLESAAIEWFGTTEDYREVGYIMADGTMLDFSEKNNGGPGGTRTLDHRAIARLYDDDDSDIDGIEAVIAFVHDGNVRVTPEAPGIELSTETKPTSRQLDRIAKFVDRADDFFAVDFVDPNGDVVHPLFYEGEISTKKVMADINRYYGEGISGVKYALEMNDAAYLKAVNSGDMRSAQKLVDAMARKAGYTVKAYHGTRNQFTEFDRGRTGDNYGGYSASGTMFDFSTDKDTARAWGAKAKGKGGVRIVPAYLKAVKTYYNYDGPVPKDLRDVLPETLDAVTKDKIMASGIPFKTYVVEELLLDWAETLYKYGYDSESIHKSYQATGDPISVYSPSQIKSADPVTYDENGEVIPLSQRFDKGNTDIRYSLDSAQDNTGSKITHQQHNYFKGTKVVDAQGKLKKVYHGTMSDFWEFSREHSNPESDMGAGYYFTDNEEDVWSNYATPNGADLNGKIERLADEYIIYEDLSEEEAVERARRELMTREEPRTIEAYLKIEKPLILDWRNSTLFDFNMNYDEETGEYGEFEGTFVDFIESVVNVLEFHEATENYIEDMQELYFKFADDETIFAYDAINAVKEVLAFYEDPESGYLAANEIIRQAIEDMGFDGIIDKMVSWKWGKDSGRRYVMKGVSSDTTHYIIFDSSQAKEVDNLEPTNSQDLRHSIDDYDEFIKKWKDAQEKYGVKNPGMAPRIETEGNEVPRQFSDDTKASNLLRTTMESPNTPEDFRDPLKLRALSGTGSYLPVSDANALDIANNIITRRGISGATDKWRGIITGQKALNKSDIALGELLLIEAADRGDLEEWEKIVGELCAEATRAGQVVQAFSMLKKLSPQGRIYNIKALVTKLQDELDVRTKGKAPALKIRQELLDQLLQARTIAEMEAIEHEIIKEIAQQIPPRISDRVVAWRYLSMLGNARTHIRNIVSNMFMMVERTLKDVVAATAEGVAGSINPNMQRTKTLAFASQEVRDFVRQDWQVMKPAMLGGGKLGFDDIFARYKKNFGKSVGGRMLNFLDKLNMEGLNVEDSIFMGVAYRKALASYLTANKFSTQFINSGTKEANEALARARKYAVEEGLKATYREANSLATALNNIEQKNVATKIIVGGLMPFKKTPLNIIKRGVEYSPAGLLEAISIETIRLARGKITAAQYFDRLSSGLVGTAAFRLGMYLAFQGLAKAGGSDDKEEYYEQMLGNQPYSITIGGRNYTIDWLTPASMPLMAGVELVTAIMKDGKIDVDEIDFNRLFEALITTVDPLTELSMLQGINQALSGYGENRLGETVASAVQSYAGQFIPTLFGQAARTVDPVRRTTYAAKDTDFPGGKKGEQFVNKLINKADVLNKVEKEPYLDMWGREDVRPDNLALRALEQFVTPYYAKDVQKTAVDDELARVFQVNKATAVLPSTPRGNITIDGTTFQLSPKEYTEYKRKVGTQSHAILDDVFKTPEYRNLDQESKEAVIKKVYSYVKEDAKADYAEKKNIEYEAESVLEKVDAAKDAGIDMGTYFVTADQIQRIESDKNPATGEGVRKDIYGLETRKTKVINYLKGLDMTPEEKYAIYLMYYSE